MKAFFIIPKIQNPNPGRWKAYSFLDLISGSLVYQLLGAVTLSTDIHLEQSSLLRKQCTPLRWVPGGEGEAFTEFEYWWAACLAGDVVLLGLWKVFTNLLLEGLNLFNRSGYIRFMCAEGIFALCYSLVDLLLLDRRCLGRGCSGCSIILFTFWTQCEEAELCSMRYYLGTLFRWDGSWNYLLYSVEMTS